MMSKLDGLFRAFDALVALRNAARPFTDRERERTEPPGTALAQNTAAQGLATQIENRLTNVVVAALKEAFDRDHARLELERQQLAEQQRRAEAALRLELRRQAADRELARLRLMAGAALLGWLASVVLLVIRVATASVASRSLLVAGWVLLLAAAGAAFEAQRRVASYAAEESDRAGSPGRSAAAALWLLIAGLAVVTVSLLT
jgi:hypothetical protein